MYYQSLSPAASMIFAHILTHEATDSPPFCSVLGHSVRLPTVLVHMSNREPNVLSYELFLLICTHMGS